MPALSPSACASASPSAMPTSSTVWWASTSRSPSAFDREVEAAVLAELAEHVVEERQAGGDVDLARPVEVERDVDRASPWCARDTVARRSGGSSWSREHLAQRGEERVVLLGRADRDPQAPVEPGPRRAVAHEHRAVDQPLPHGRPVDRRGRNRMKLAPDGHTSTGSSASAAPAGRAPRRARPRALSISATNRSARRPATCLAASRWYGSATCSSVRTTSAGAMQ